MINNLTIQGERWHSISQAVTDDPALLIDKPSIDGRFVFEQNKRYQYRVPVDLGSAPTVTIVIIDLPSIGTGEAGTLLQLNNDSNAIDIYFVDLLVESGLTLFGYTNEYSKSIVNNFGYAGVIVACEAGGAPADLFKTPLNSRTVAHEIVHYLMDRFGFAYHRPNPSPQHLMNTEQTAEIRELPWDPECFESRQSDPLNIH